MDSVLEKITLYDILGYLLPGSVLMLLLLYGLKQDELTSAQNQWRDNQGFLYFVFFLVSYLVGIVLSEMMTQIWKIGKWFFKKVRKIVKKGDRIIGIRRVNRFIQRKEDKRTEKLLIEQIAVALKKSGIKDETGVIINSVNDGTFGKRYMQYMYGIIQKYEECKRIHNYASAYVLYKNVAGALLIGAVFILCNCDCRNHWFGVGCILMSLIFIARGIRFQNKKEDYTVIWFLEKFMAVEI